MAAPRARVWLVAGGPAVRCGRAVQGAGCGSGLAARFCRSTVIMVMTPPATVTVKTAPALITDATAAPVMSAASPAKADAGMMPATTSVKNAMDRPGTDQGEDVAMSSVMAIFRVPSSKPL